MNRPVAFLSCRACGTGEMKLYISQKSLGAICPTCGKFVFDISDLTSFIDHSLFKARIPRDTERLVN